MPTPSEGYHWQGDRLPGTTTVIGRYKESGGLIWWAWEEGYKQAKAGKLLKHRETSEKAADIGTAAHAMIEARVNGLSDADIDNVLMELSTDGEFTDKARNAYGMYLKWEKQTKLKLLSKYQEIRLVHPEILYGGTPDAIGEINGEIVLLDWKTSNGLYPDYLIQLAAYTRLINEGVLMETGEPLSFKVSGGAHLLRFAKEFPDFGHHYFGSLDDEWEQFKDYRRCYERDKQIKKRAK